VSIELPTGGTQTILEEATNISVDNGDHERFAHYVKKDKILQSALSGEEVVALCGKKWVPGRDPQKFPVCPDCKKIYDGIPDKSDKDKDKGNDN
jgi:hypothetical protein